MDAVVPLEGDAQLAPPRGIGDMVGPVIQRLDKASQSVLQRCLKVGHGGVELLLAVDDLGGGLFHVGHLRQDARAQARVALHITEILVQTGEVAAVRRAGEKT